MRLICSHDKSWGCAYEMMSLAGSHDPARKTVKEWSFQFYQGGFGSWLCHEHPLLGLIKLE